MQIELDVNKDKLQEDIVTQIMELSHHSVSMFIGNLIVQQFVQQLENLKKQSYILRYVVEFKHPAYYVERMTFSLNDIVTKPMFSVGYIAGTIVTDKAAQRIHFLPPHNLRWLYESGVKYVSLKTIQKSILRMYDIGLPASVISPAVEALENRCECPQEMLLPYIKGVWDWILYFICKICGKTYFCTCFQGAFENHYAKAMSQKHRFAPDGWPHKFIQLYERSTFRDNLCHLCSNTPSDLYYCPPGYGSKIKMRYGPYIIRTSLEKGISEDEAEYEIRQLLGIKPKGKAWTSEIELLHMAQLAFPGEKIEYQASPEWLGRQRIDVYFPQLKIALEYQGRQHYAPVAFFGGEDAFRMTQNRDNIKYKKCAEHNIDLIYFRYDERISVEMVKAKITKVLKARAK